MSADPAIQQYYSDLLAIQYKSKPRAIATIQALVNCSLCDGLPQALQTAFDLDTAAGDQLTLIGKLVGVPRNVVGLDLTHTFFSFTDYSGSPASIGFGSYSDSPYPSDLFLSYITDASYSLTDFEMRFLIQLAIVNRISPMSFQNIKETLYAFFDGAVDIVPGFDPSAGDYFTFTSYVGSPASNGFNTYADYPTLVGTFFSSYSYFPMSLAFNVASIYTNAWSAAEFLKVVPVPIGVAHTTNFV